jgi:hypothetical protein
MSPILHAKLALLSRLWVHDEDDFGPAAHLGETDKFDTAIADFSQRYADQDERDRKAFLKAIRSGRLHATEGP